MPTSSIQVQITNRIRALNIAIANGDTAKAYHHARWIGVLAFRLYPEFRTGE